MDSILTSIKKLLGIMDSYTQFDADIIMHINSAINVLSQIGLSSAEGFYISDESAVWSDLIDDGADLDLVKTYIYLKVRMAFDPPTGAVADSFKEMIKEHEWRIMVKEDRE